MVVEGEAMQMNNQESTEPDSTPGCVWEEENRRLTPQKESVGLGLEFNKEEVEQEEKEVLMSDSSSDSSHASDNEDSDSDNSLLTSKEWAG